MTSQHNRTIAWDIASCLAVVLFTLPILSDLFLVPNERTAAGKGMSHDRAETALLLIGIYAIVTAIAAGLLLFAESYYEMPPKSWKAVWISHSSNYFAFSMGSFFFSLAGAY